MTLTALDISQYSGDVTLADFQRAKAAGCSRIIVALNDLPLAKQQIERASKAGLEVEGYIYLYFARSISARVKACLLAIANLPVRRVWLDAEDTSSGVTQASIIDGLRLAEGLVTAAGYATGIYTATWFWKQHAGDSQAFKHLPLWDAYWDKHPGIDRPTYGGWAEAEMSQHTADTHFAGIWCDINSYRPSSPASVAGSVPNLGMTDRTNLEALLGIPGVGKWQAGEKRSGATVTLAYQKTEDKGSMLIDTFVLTRARKVK